VTQITMASARLVHAGAMSKARGYTIEMIELVGGTSAPFGPSFGVFTSLFAAQKVAAIRIALSAPRSNPIGYRILDRNGRQVRFWQADASR
jgi:hypothetical protein